MNQRQIVFRWIGVTGMGLLVIKAIFLLIAENLDHAFYEINSTPDRDERRFFVVVIILLLCVFILKIKFGNKKVWLASESFVIFVVAFFTLVDLNSFNDIVFVWLMGSNSKNNWADVVPPALRWYEYAEGVGFMGLPLLIMGWVGQIIKPRKAVSGEKKQEGQLS